MATVELSFTPLPAHVRTARLVATAVARRTGVEESLLDEVRLAVGEACSRAVEAHRLHCPGEPVRVRLSEQDGRFEVVVADAAAAGGVMVPRQAASGAVVAGPAGQAASRPGAAAPGGQDAAERGTADPAAPGTAAGGGAVNAPVGLADVPGDSFLADLADLPGDSFPAGLGLAVIAGLADDVEISTTAAGVTIRMSWPAHGRPEHGAHGRPE